MMDFAGMKKFNENAIEMWKWLWYSGRGTNQYMRRKVDAAFLTNTGLLTKPYEYIFCKAIKRIQSGKAIPKFMMDAVMGKDNNSIIEMLYPNITSITIKNACEFMYCYNIPENIKSYKGTVLFRRGSNEQYPGKSVTLLKKISACCHRCRDWTHGAWAIFTRT